MGFLAVAAQRVEARVVGGLEAALRAGLKAYAEEWRGVVDRVVRPHLDAKALECQDLHTRCPEWAAVVFPHLTTF